MIKLIFAILAILVLTSCATTAAGSYRIPQEKEGGVGVGLKILSHDEKTYTVLMLHGKGRAGDANEIYAEIHFTPFLEDGELPYFSLNFGWLKYFQSGIDDGGSFQLGGGFQYASRQLLFDVISAVQVTGRRDDLLLRAGLSTSLGQLILSAAGSGGFYGSPRGPSAIIPFSLDFGAGYQTDSWGALGNITLPTASPIFTVEGFATP